MTVNIENEYVGNAALALSGASFGELAGKVVEAVIKHENCPYEAEVEILLTSDESIREMNFNFRGIDKSTDVLSFPMIEYEAPSCFDGFDEEAWLFNQETGELLLGDIVISVDHAVSQAGLYGHSQDREFAFLIAHSVLHLLGYDHMEPVERNRMEEKQEAVLDSLGIYR